MIHSVKMEVEFDDADEAMDMLRMTRLGPGTVIAYKYSQLVKFTAYGDSK